MGKDRERDTARVEAETPEVYHLLIDGSVDAAHDYGVYEEAQAARVALEDLHIGHKIEIIDHHGKVVSPPRA